MCIYYCIYIYTHKHAGTLFSGGSRQPMEIHVWVCNGLYGMEGLQDKDISADLQEPSSDLQANIEEEDVDKGLESEGVEQPHSSTQMSFPKIDTLQLKTEEDRT